MGNLAVAQDCFSSEHGAINRNIEYHSAEFCIKGLDCSYQFKLWQVTPGLMQIIIRDNSAVLTRLEAGQVYHIKYYSNESICPISYHETLIKHITKAEEGRFKGHYLVDLAMFEGVNEFRKERSSEISEGLWF